SLLIAITCGAALAAGLAFDLPLPYPSMTDLHARWAGAGWVGLLIIGVSLQVIPMFQATALFPHWLARGLPWALALCLISGPALPLAVCFSAYGLVALALLWRRKRAPETVTLYWCLSMASLLACTATAGHPVLLGVLFLYGFAWSAVAGMLHK